MSFFEQVKALVIKDFQIAKRNRVGTIAEMIVPIVAGCIAGVLILVLSIISTDGDEWSDTDQINVSAGTSFLRATPVAPFAQQYLDAVNTQLATSFENNERNYSFYDIPTVSTSFLTEIVVNVSFATRDNSFGVQAKTDAKTNVNSLFVAFATILAEKSSLTAGSIGSLLGSLLFNRDATDGKAPGSVNSNTWYRPLYLDINLRGIFSSSGMLMLLYAFIPSALTNGSRLVTEKKLKVRESLRVMGVSDTAYLTAHFISMFIRLFFGCLLIAVILLAFKAIDGDAVLPVLGISVIFCFSMICEAQMMPALFSADVWTNVFNIFFITGAATLSQFTTASSKSVQILVCLLSPGGYYYAILPYLSKDSMKLNLTSGEAALIMIIDSVIYFLIANYIYNVFPGDWGVPRHPLYFISWMWESGSSDKRHGNKKSSGQQSLLDNSQSINAASVSPVLTPAEGNHQRNGVDNASPPARPSASSAAALGGPTISGELHDVNHNHGGGEGNLFVNIKGLVKQFGSSPAPAVDHLDLTVKRGEIFALLGHNGAGKTTTISMITGVLDSTSYELAEIGGFDLRREMNEIRRNIALCPQFDVLFPECTAQQHLELFARLKGRPATDPYIKQLMKDLSLPDGDDPCKVYSGGTQRRLSVANSLVGGASFVLLDEPSSGMDPVSRRKMWNLIKAEKQKGRTFILTTHFMEEADFLGDRIGIMSAGKMKVCATSTELKHRYDVGYTLTCTKASREVKGDVIFQLIKKHVPKSSLKLDSDGEVQFLVQSDDLTPLLVELEENQAALHIQSYGIDACTLEDVFVRLASEEDEERKKNKNGGENAHKEEEDNNVLYNAQVEEQFERKYAAALAESSAARIWFQSKLTLRRCFLQLSRSLPVKVFAIMFPLVLMALGFLTLRPNETSNHGNFGKTYDWIELSDSTELNLVMVDLHHDDNAPFVSRFQEEFNALWRAHMGLPSQVINWYVAKSYTDFATGQYVPLYGFTFTGPQSPPVYGGVIPHGWSAERKEANYTMLWTQRYDPVQSIPLAACFRAAADKVVGRISPTASFSRGNFTFVPQKIDYKAIVDKIINETAGKTNGTVPKNGDGDSDAAGATAGGTTYNVMVLGLYFVLSVGQLVAATQRGYADELKRKVYRVLMLNGLHPLAHVIGNFLFSFIVSLWCLFILIVGLVLKGVESDTNGGVLGPILLAALLFVCHTILFCVWITSYFPGKSPASYTLLVHMYNIITMGAPYLIDKLFSVGHFGFQAAFRPFLLAFFPSCAFYHVLDVASSVPPAKAEAGRLFEFGNDSVTENARTGWCFVFLGAEMAIPLLLVHNFVYNVGVYAWVMRRRDGMTEKDAQQAAARNFKESMGEQQALLAEHNNNNTYNNNDNINTRNQKQNLRSSGSSSNNCSNNNNNNNKGHCIVATDDAHNGECVLTIEQLEDDDVRNERARTSRQPSQLTLDHLRKTFNNGTKVAIHDLCLGIEERECFGLLGPNGAGKSTACACTMRELLPSGGSIEYLKGMYSISKTPTLECYSNVRLGVCLQTDTLWEYCTAAEHIEYYLKLRLLDQYDPADWDGYIGGCLDAIQLNDVAQKEAGGFSGGMKRKLQVCLAMYTGPRLVFLDEPSTGLDSFARRALWKVIKNALTSNASVILTTHSMDEAEAVCGRIGIMTNGVLRCVNTPQNLKTLYGSNFVVTTELLREVDFGDESAMKDAVERIRNDLAEMFLSASLIEHVGSLCRFQVSKIPSLARAFQELDKKKEAWKIRTYAVSQMASLEQIFVNMVKTGGGNVDEEAM